MTRPLSPRLPEPGRPRPAAPLLMLAVVGLGVVTSAAVGLHVGDRSGAGGAGSAGSRPLGPAGTVALAVPAEPVVPVAAFAAAGHSIQIAGFAYAPQSLTVTVGDSITWTNQDEAPHTVTTTSGPEKISSPMLSKGQSFTFTFTVPGTYSYYCAVHPDMRAQVVVNPAPAAPSTPSSTGKSPSAAPPPPTHSVASATTHSTAPSMDHSSHSDHEAASSTGAAPVRSSASSAPAVSSVSPGSPASSAMPAPSSAVVAAPPSQTSPASPAAAAPSASTTDAAAIPAAVGSTPDPVNATLLLAGLTGGATVYCLLLVASRRPQGTGPGKDES